MASLLLPAFGVAPLSSEPTCGSRLSRSATTRSLGGRPYGLTIVRRLWLRKLPASALTTGWFAIAPSQSADRRLAQGVVACTVLLTAIVMLLQQSVHGAQSSPRAREPAQFPAAPVRRPVGGPMLRGRSGAFVHM
jgi:hypothetical protein